MWKINVLRAVWAASHVGAVYAFLNLPSEMLIIGCIYSMVLHAIGQGIGLHRFFAHRGFEVSTPIKLFFNFLTIPCALGSPISWVALHRHHHAVSDTIQDNQSPYYNSFISIWFCLYINSNNLQGFKLIRDLINDKFQVTFHKHYITLLLLWTIIMISFGLQAFLLFYCIPITFVFTMTMLGSIVVHKWGYRNYDTNDHSVNSIPVSLLTFGDGWHNNHHNQPKKYKHGERWFEFDLQAKLIDLIKL